MKINDLFQETYSALTANKARSGLTVLGIVIGIGSVIAMVSIGQGTQNTISQNIESLGSNLIMIMPGAQRSFGAQVSQGRGSAQTLTLDDALAIAQDIGLVKAVAPEVSGRYQAVYKSANTNTSVLGVTADYPIVRNLAMAEGSFISQQNINSLTKVAVLGPTARDDLFGENATDVIGQTIRIKQVSFKIIGITQAKGGSGFNNQDDIIFTPITTAQQFLSGSDNLTSINVAAIDQKQMTQAQEEITNLLLVRHNIADISLADFNILNQADIISTASSVTNTFTILLGSVAAISLLVGGIGIMNMMLTSVTERTREIGLRKAIGAKSGDINRQFLSEAISLTLLGGVLGVVLGWLIAFLVYKFAGIETKVALSSVILAFGVSAGIGIIFGYYPARRASRLNPIEALRYE